jgi:hypothetical protein
VKDKTNCWFSFFWVASSYHIPKATNDVHVHFFIHSSNAVNYTSEFQEVFEDRLLTVLKHIELQTCLSVVL